MNEQSIRKIVMVSIEKDMPNYCKDDIVEHLYNEIYTDYIVDVVGEEFTESELPTSDIVAYWHDIRDEVIESAINEFEWGE